MPDLTTDDRRDDQTDNAMRSITAEQQTRTRLADNYGSYFRFMSQMYGGD